MANDDINAYLVRRDADGNVEPYEVDVLSIRDEPMKISILPTTLGSLKGLKDPNADCIQWTVEDKIRYVREHIVKPDFSTKTAEELMDQMTIWDLDMLLIAAIQHGGPMRQRTEKEKAKKGPTKRSGQSKRRSPRSKRTSTN